MWRLFVVFFLFCSASFVLAQVEITEVMYDLEGSDTYREWVEIYNNGSEDIDLQDWRFVEVEGENEKKHTFLPYPEDEDVVIKSNSYAVIVIKPNVFLNDWNGFSGKILDSSFSLRQKNDIGEKLIIRDSEKNDIDSVTYDPLWGASGDGSSLQKINNSWTAGSPTPGEANVLSDDETSPDDNIEENDTEEETNEDFSGSIVSGGSVYEPAVEPKIIARAGVRERVAVVGARVVFNGAVFTVEGDEILGARYIWNFGDGSNGRSQKIEHTYYYPGEYAVVLDVASGVYAATDRVKVIVSPADIVISEIGDEKDFFVEVVNNTKYELDVSGWKMQAGGDVFIFPKGTYIFPKKSIRVASNTTNFSFSKEVSLLYPNGTIVYVYQGKDSTTEPVVINEPVIRENRDLFVKNTVIENEADDVVSSASLVMGERLEVDNVSVVQEVRQEEFVQLASAYETKKTSPSKKEDGLFWGFMGVSLISLIAIYAVLESKNVAYTSGVKSEADLYKIIEIDPD